MLFSKHKVTCHDKKFYSNSIGCFNTGEHAEDEKKMERKECKIKDLYDTKYKFIRYLVESTTRSLNNICDITETRGDSCIAKQYELPYKKMIFYTIAGLFYTKE